MEFQYVTSFKVILYRDGQTVDEGEKVDNDKVFTASYDNGNFEDFIFSVNKTARYIRIFP